MHHVKPILLVWLLALWEGCVDAEKHTMYTDVTDHLLQVRNLPQLAFKKSIRKALFAALESEEDYIEAPNLLFKINLHFT